VLSAPQVGKTVGIACWLLGYTWASCAPLTWWCAPTYASTMAGFTIHDQLTLSSGVQAWKRESPSAGKPPAIGLVNGSRIEFRSWDSPGNMTGPTVYAAAVDEAHELTALARKAITSRMASTLGPIRYIGNTGDVDGPFFDICEHAEDPARAEYSFFRKWTWTDKWNALGGDATHEGREYHKWIDEQRGSLPTWMFEALYEAKWIESLEAVFRRVEERTTLAPTGPQRGVSYAIGMDVAEAQDFTVLMPVPIGRKTIDITGMDRFHRIDYDDQVIRAENYAKLWNNATIYIEINGPGRPLYHRLRKRGKVSVRPWTTEPKLKNDAVMLTAGDIEFGRMRLAPLSPLQAELRAYRAKRNPGGAFSYSAKSGSHDDTVMALVIGNWAAQKMARRLMLID
jgi:hypothetical protein